jgi:hypothetical protein
VNIVPEITDTPPFNAHSMIPPTLSTASARWGDKIRSRSPDFSFSSISLSPGAATDDRSMAAA